MLIEAGDGMHSWSAPLFLPLVGNDTPDEQPSLASAALQKPNLSRLEEFLGKLALLDCLLFECMVLA